MNFVKPANSFQTLVGRSFIKNVISNSKPMHNTVGFWCQTIHKKFLRRFDTIFGLKMMMKSGLEKIILKFHDGLQSCCCPVQKNLPRKAELAWQVSRYLWRPPWNFKIFFSRPLFIIILSQKWCQISVRIFCVLPGTKNLQCYDYDRKN